MATGGSVEAISIDGREFAVAADQAATIKRGGYENEQLANGNGTARLSKTRVTWMVSGLQLEVDETNDDGGFLQEIADSNENKDFTITLADGTTLQGVGSIVGELAVDTQNSTASADFGGPRKLTTQ